MLADLFKRIEVSPRVSFWISICALAIVLFNNHVYISSVQEKEREANLLMRRNIAEAQSQATKSRLLKQWETALNEREAEVRDLLKQIKKKSGAN